VSPLDRRWVRTWAADITAHLQSVLAAFDTYYPFPPGENEVILAGPDRSAFDGTSSDLITFYEVIQEVVMSDIGNGFFIRSSEDVIAHGDTGLIFASNGGGLLYAIDRDNTVHRSRDASTDSDFEPVAADLRGFLEQVLGAVAHFTATRSPGDI
jgi:hypothetical protein